MNIARTTAIVGSMGVLAGLLVAPVQAADGGLDVAAKAMLQAEDISPSLGTPHGQSFSFTRGQDSTPWLCFDGKGRSVQGKRAKDVHLKQYWLNKKGSDQLAQSVYTYASGSAAGSAWKDLKTKIKKCTGTSAGGPDQPRQSTRHGSTSRKYDGRTGRWVYSTIGSSKNGEGSVMVFFRNGKSIQAVEYDARLGRSQAAANGAAVVVVTIVALAIILLARWAEIVERGYE